jgi:beta-galactosidase/beta-glucuronidase
MVDPVAKGGAMSRMVTAALATLAVGAAAFGYVQFTKVSDLRAQLTAATEEAREATTEETDLRSQLSTAQQRFNAQAQKLTALRQADAEPPSASAAPAAQAPADSDQQLVQDAQALPIRLTFHDALLGSGKVAVLQNLSDNDLEVVFDAQTPASNAHERRRLLVNAHGLRRLGPAQGLPLAPGQVVTLNSAKYRPLVQTVG